MPFSSLTDANDLARAQAAMEAAWAEVKLQVSAENCERERTKLAYIIASLVPLALDEADLRRRALERYRSRR